MTQEEIIEGNKLIAEFMGCKYQQLWCGGDECWKWGFKDTHITELWYESDFYYRTPYHTSWNWLMPVWNKFRTLQFSGDNISSLYSRHRYFTFIISSKISNCDIELAFKELVEGINWYNKNKLTLNRG